MAKTGRNNTCPCGSGKKYKQCCLARDEAAERPASKTSLPLGPFGFFEPVEDDFDKLDEDSNAVVDLIHAGKLDKAEQAAHALLKRYPDAPDGYDRLGMICEAPGRKTQGGRILPQTHRLDPRASRRLRSRIPGRSSAACRRTGSPRPRAGVLIWLLRRLEQRTATEENDGRPFRRALGRRGRERLRHHLL
jgi:hypothetical protein